jgi:chemotaxis protein methyltransferase CheR
VTDDRRGPDAGHAPEPDDGLVRELVRCAAARTGIRPEAIPEESIRRMARAKLAEGHTAAHLLAEALRGAGDAARALCEAVTIGETFFFRHPEHFDFIAEHATRPTGRPLRAWSAGCATGEEAYSLAACLLSRGSPGGVQVVGTDIVERNVVFARGGVFGSRSLRVAGPLLYPLFVGEGPNDSPPSAPSPNTAIGLFDSPKLRIHERIRETVSFAVHSVLDAPPAGGFDVVFCRNVLLYFTPETVRRACENLARALAPGGILVFGTCDLPGPPVGLCTIGPPGTQIFRESKGTVPPPRARSVPPLPSYAPARSLRSDPPAAAHPAPSPSAEPVPEACIAIHLKALAFIEHGDRAGAERVLRELQRAAPDYIPGLLERALWHRRAGAYAQCRALMNEVLMRTRRLPPEQVIAGPEPLPARFYARSAMTFLEGHGGER